MSMTEPKLTDAQWQALFDADILNARPCHDLPRIGVVARMVAEAEQAGRAEAWDEGWKAGQGSGFRFTPPNPYREATP